MSDGVTITVNDNGPYMIEGPCRVTDAEGAVWDVAGPKVWLCRCGASTNKPFCDGAHKEAGFASCDRAGSDA